jgi:hypothetical protein
VFVVPPAGDGTTGPPEPGGWVTPPRGAVVDDVGFLPVVVVVSPVVDVVVDGSGS